MPEDRKESRRRDRDARRDDRQDHRLDKADAKVDKINAQAAKSEAVSKKRKWLVILIGTVIGAAVFVKNYFFGG